MTPKQFNAIKELNNHAIRLFEQENDIIRVFLDVPKDVCHARIKKRDRNAEKNISVSYMERCHENHKLFGKEHAHFIIDYFSQSTPLSANLIAEQLLTLLKLVTSGRTMVKKRSVLTR